jgi:CheY-like chemotaxis protein/GAF domain-containing protein
VATILVVDDNAINRKLLVALLSGDGHLTLQASDGADGLTVARQHRPQLIISDILMPSMDGYAFVRALRREPQLRGTPVIFYTAHYHEREAHNLARSLGVSRVLVKPSPHGELLKAVEQVMAGVPESEPDPVPENFDREHLRLLTDKLSERAAALAVSNSRFAALADLSLEIASQHSSAALLERACAGARNLVGSQFAVLAIAEQSAEAGVSFTTSGIEDGKHALSAPDLHAGALGGVIAQRQAWRSCRAKAPHGDFGLPQGYPEASAFLAVPLMTPARVFGWLCLADKIGAECFDADDEKLLLTLGGLVSRTFENTRLHAELQRQSTRLERVHAVLRAIQGLIANGQDDEEICRAACSLCVEAGGYHLAFVEVGEIRGGACTVIAAAGNALAAADAAAPKLERRFETDDLVELAGSTRSPAICNDLHGTRLRVRQRHELLKHGFRSMAVLPLGDAAGRRLILASNEACAFDPAELHLLRDMAEGFSLALARSSEAAIGS